MRAALSTELVVAMYSATDAAAAATRRCPRASPPCRPLSRSLALSLSRSLALSLSRSLALSLSRSLARHTPPARSPRAARLEEAHLLLEPLENLVALFVGD
jgi:hypothetical protein